MEQAIVELAQRIRRAQRVLVITGAGISADSGLPTYRGLGGLYNGLTEEGMPIEQALSALTLRDRPQLCWKYLAQVGRAVLSAEPNAGHRALAQLQQIKPEVWLLTQNIDGYHLAAGSPAERLIEIHGRLDPLYCQSCGLEENQWSGCMHDALPPLCQRCAGVLRPSVVLFEELLPETPVKTLYQQLRKGFDVVLVIGTSASFPYIMEPVLETRKKGGFCAQINPDRSAVSPYVDLDLTARALDVLPRLLSHITAP